MIHFFKTKQKIGQWGKGCTVELNCDVLGVPIDLMWREHFINGSIMLVELRDWR